MCLLLLLLWVPAPPAAPPGHLAVHHLFLHIKVSVRVVLKELRNVVLGIRSLVYSGLDLEERQLQLQLMVAGLGS